MTDDFFRFPHTPHIAWLGDESPRDDKVLAPEEVTALLSGSVVVEEKLDGANLGLSVGPDGQLRAQNRGQYLFEPYAGQFQRLPEWMALHGGGLVEALGDTLIAFGEWCAARHSLDYPALPDLWLLFDIYDREQGRFWSTRRRDAFASTLGFAVVPRIAVGPQSVATLMDGIEHWKSRYRNGGLEGVVVRREDNDWLLARGKLVRADFTQAIDSHWRSRKLEWNRVTWPGDAMTAVLPPLVAKAFADAGYDLLSPAEDGWMTAAISGTAGCILVRAVDEGVLLAVAEPTMAQRIGLALTGVRVPAGMADIGVAHGAVQVYEALHMLRSLQMHPASALSARVETRLTGIPETERTREVRQRIGQDVFREALMDLWQGRCAVTGIPFPPELLRASHAKPWAKATDAERLDPFNGLLLATHLDAMFDSGLIGFDEQGRLIASPQLDPVTRAHFGMHEDSRLRSMAPGHEQYLAWHREFVLRRQVGV